MKKISIIGAGNVGATSALRIAQEGLGKVMLVDVVKGLAKGKAFDLRDARNLLGIDYDIDGSDDLNDVRDSDIVVVTAGLARKPGMTREELILKNAAILKSVCLKIKESAPQAVLIIVTNPLDIMTNYALKITGFKPDKVFGMGISLDAARFANIIAEELKVNVCDVNALVIGSHGEGMLPLPGLSGVKGAFLDKAADKNKISQMVERTVSRGAEIVGLLGSGSAYYAPSAAISALVKAVALDESRQIGVCARLNGEYGIKDVCIGVPCIIGKEGISSIKELKLTQEESAVLKKSAETIRELASKLPL